MKTSAHVPPSLYSNSKHSRALRAGFGLLALLALASTSASALTWDPAQLNSGSVGGAGVWNTSSNIWTDGTADQAWPSANTTTETAIFGGTNSYIVTLASGTEIAVGGLTLNATIGGNSVTIGTAAGSSLRLNGATPTINVASGGLYISAVMTGSNGFTKTGGGTLYLNVANTYTGATNLNTGQITLAANNGLATTTAFTIGSANFTMQGFNQKVASLSGTSGALVRTTSGTSTLTVEGSSTTSYAGGLSDGSGTARLNLVVNGGNLTLTGAAKAHRGTTTVTSGTLVLGTSLSGSSSVVVDGGTLASNVSSVTLGTGSVELSNGGFITPGGVGTAGTMTLAAGQNFSSTLGTLNFDVGTAFDQITGTGAFSLNGTTLALTLGSGFSYSLTYGILSGFTTGSVTGLNITGYDTVNWVASVNNAGVLSFSATAVPEPSTWAAFAGAAALSVAIIRRRRNARS